MNEIKIPDGCKSIKIEQESDNRIVITFESENNEWKNGDILFSKSNEYEYIVIFKKLDLNREDSKLCYHAMLTAKKKIKLNSNCNEFNQILATDQQREELFAALEKEGYRWNAEKLEIEKIEWVPKDGEECWYVAYDTDTSLFVAKFWKYIKNVSFNKLIKKTEQEAQALCDKLNAAIN